MACSINIFSTIQDVNQVISALSKPSLRAVEHSSESEQDDWESSWEWQDSSDAIISPLWLQDCSISLSPANDTLAIAKHDKAVFLSSKWNKDESAAVKTKYEVSWSGRLAVQQGEYITDVLCIPVASQHRSSQGSPDWTCIVVGFSSGYMRIYLQNGSLIFGQRLHEDKVVRLKCRTWEPHRDSSNHENVEELAILYSNALVIIDGFSLYQSLRACRNQLAKAQASAIHDYSDPPPLAYKKWRFDGQKNIFDIASCGVVTPNLFDQLQTASFIGGHNEIIRDSVPAMSHYVTSGFDPFVAVYSALEGSGPPLISDVAIAVASKLTSAVLSKLSVAGGWLGWGSSPSSTTETRQPKPHVEKGTKLPARYGLPDHQRLGNTINLAPNGKLAVVTDEFGRILLIDVIKGLAVRMWKGYRDAECGWVIVDECQDQDGRHPTISQRTALFLVIYASKRGILEVWRTEQGPRIAAFNVGKDCRLLYSGHGILGTGHVHRHGQSPPQHTFNCTLIHGDGTLKTFSVPFHNALSDKHNNRLRDLHLLKKLTSLLDNLQSKAKDCSKVVKNLNTQIKDVLVDIRTPQLQQRGLQCILGTVGIPGPELLSMVELVLGKAEKEGKSDDNTQEWDDLIKFCNTQSRLLQAYCGLLELSSKTLENRAFKSEEGKGTILALSQLLGLSKSETESITRLLDDFYSSQHGFPVAVFQSDVTEMTASLFLGCFEHVSSLPKNKSDVEVGLNFICLKKTLSTELRLKLANFMFMEALLNSSNTEYLRLPLDLSGIHPSHLMDLLIFFWLESPNGAYQEIDHMFSLFSIVSIIFSLTGNQAFAGLDSESDASSWWQRVRDTIAQSSSLAKALSLAAVCRSVALEMSTSAQKIQEEEKDAEQRALAVGDWVSISSEIEQWNVLIFRLDDVIAMRTFVNRLPLVLNCKPRDMPTPRDKTINGSRPKEFSVDSILNGGLGASGRVLAQYLVLYEVQPKSIGNPKELDINIEEKVQDDDHEMNDDDKPLDADDEAYNGEILQGLDKLQSKFVHSLHQDVLWASCALECVTQWPCEKEKTDKLFLAINHLKSIHSIGLKHGIAAILWNKNFREKVSALAFLMEKVGKAPKERLCRKTFDVGYSSLVEFLKAAKMLLEFLSEIDMSEAEVLVLRSEDFWPVESSSQKSPVEVALDEPTSNRDLLCLYNLLVTIMWTIMALDMKSVRPLSLFDAATRGAFTKTLSSIPPVPSHLDERTSQARNKFCTRALSMYASSMSTVNRSAEDQSRTTSSDVSAVIFMIAEQLNEDIDSLRRHYICELYSTGLDSMGSQAVFSVEDKKTLGQRLLVTIGQRLAHTLVESETTSSVIHLSRLPTSISRWIKNQDPSKLSCRSVDLDRTNELLSTVITLLPDDSPDFVFASDLSGVLKTLVR